MNTTLCYIEKDGKYLMLHRTKKDSDINHDKWIGVGGKFEPGESPEECLIREVKEETGVTLDSYRYCGIITFASDIQETEYMHLFKGYSYTGEINFNCSEGVLEWVSKEELSKLSLWEGDKIFLPLMDREENFFSLKLMYSGDALVGAILNGKSII